MKRNAFAIGVASYEYINILLSYYPKNLDENFDIFIFVDTRRIPISKLESLVKSFNIPVWNNATYIDNQELYEDVIEDYSFKGKATDILINHGCIFKILPPIYLPARYDYERVLTSDDDVFIFDDISPIFNTYKEFAFKKETLFTFKTSKKHKLLKGFNEIFGTDFSLERINGLPLNAGNILSIWDDKLPDYFYKFMTSDTVHHMYYDYKGYTPWTIEQRFQHFNMHRLMNDGKNVEFFTAEDLRLLLTVGKKHPEKHLANKVPKLLHYAIGKKKPQFLREFLPRLTWKYGFDYEPKYELKGKIFQNENKLF